MDSTRDLSVGELLEHLLADSLIDACHITGEFVTIVQGTKRHSFPYQQARTFLLGMLRGRSWNLKAGEVENEYGVPRLRAVDRRREDESVHVDAIAELERARPEEDVLVEDPPPSPTQFVRSIGPALDELLAMAVDIELIESSFKDEAGRTVTIVLSACQTQMRFDEAVVFLTECILYKLNAMRADVLKLSEDAGRGDASGRAGRIDDPPARARAAGEEPVWEPLG